MMKRIHINRHVIAANKKHDQDNPPLTVRTSRGTEHGHRVLLLWEGRVVARIVYDRHHPLSCGATAWIETQLETKVETDGRQ